MGAGHRRRIKTEEKVQVVGSVEGKNLSVLAILPRENAYLYLASLQLLYLDPPFNLGIHRG